MKFITSIILIALLSIAAGLYFPSWSIAIVALIVTVAIPQRPLRSFFAGFLALLLAWGVLSWYLSSNNDHLLAHKMSPLILGIDNPYMLILVTALIGAIIGGLGALTGSFIRRSPVNQ